MKICSKCHSSMQERQVLGYEIDFCKNCHSVYLDKNELSLTKKGSFNNFKGEINFQKKEVSKKFNCPSCQNKMEEFIFAFDSNIWIDRCPSCSGIFLEHGELTAIDKFLEKVDQEKVPADLKEKIALEKEKINASFQKMQQENDQLYGIIDEIPGIKLIINFLDIFIR